MASDTFPRRASSYCPSSTWILANGMFPFLSQPPRCVDRPIASATYAAGYGSGKRRAAKRGGDVVSPFSPGTTASRVPFIQAADHRPQLAPPPDAYRKGRSGLLHSKVGSRSGSTQPAESLIDVAGLGFRPPTKSSTEGRTFALAG